ncbi:MAG: hypothetical protein WCA81_08200 [Rhizomicrobium sp.]
MARPNCLRIAIIALLSGLLPAATPGVASSPEPLPEKCEYPAPGHVVYSGPSGKQFGACLDGAHRSEIRELKISSHGGDAWQTLQVVERYRGKIDLVIVTQWCNSSCANYVIPAATNLIVLPHSYVTVHGSIDPDAIADYNNAQRKILASKYPQVPASEWDKTFKKTIDGVKAELPVQNDFEKRLLSCPAWLHPDEYVASEIAKGRLHKSAKEVKGLVVTKKMAMRCLKHTHILSYWSPASQSELPSELSKTGAVLAP